MRMRTKHINLSRGLPKTGQTHIVPVGGDGTYQAGWWRGLTFDDNKVRFIEQTIDGDDIVIDRATGLIWAADGDEAGCHNGTQTLPEAAIIYAEGLVDFAGYSDWRIPNINELLSIVQWELSNPCIYTVFTNTVSSEYWTSSLYNVDPNDYWAVNFNNSKINNNSLLASLYVRCVRGGI